MESNHRFLDVNQASLPLDQGTVFRVFQWTHPESHRDLRLATPASSCWTMSPFSERRFARKHAPKDLNPDQLVWNQSCCHYTRGVCCFSGSRETRTHKSRSRPPVFKTGPSSSRMTSVVASCGSWNRTNGLLVQSQASLPTATTPQKDRKLKHSVRESHPICELQRLAPRLRAGESALRESNPPRQVGSLEPLPLGQGHRLFQAEGEGVEPSRP